ncbi:MAG: type II toxin-antitoxin system RelE/ParE family toxin [Hyphomicrobiales bacterium]|nr:MAG: type II toxin-antitoxin system RelE/ParE family toxin [Hyphomicrobiales bacterium]
MNSYRLADRADRDIFNIFLYGMENFGLAQAEKYRDSMLRCFNMLAENPHIGRGADSVAPGVRRHEHGSHVILYEPESSGVLILALVPARSVQRLQID